MPNLIESLFTNTCKILRKVSGSDGWNERQGVIWKENISCLFRDKTGFVDSDDKAKQVKISGTLFITEELLENDQVVLDDDYKYDIIPNGILTRKDLMTGSISHYEIKLTRREKFDEEQIEVTASS